MRKYHGKMSIVGVWILFIYLVASRERQEGSILGMIVQSRVGNGNVMDSNNNNGSSRHSRSLKSFGWKINKAFMPTTDMHNLTFLMMA
jgi:hypothetical protein